MTNTALSLSRVSPDEGVMGEAMLALTPRQRKFVTVLLTSGRNNHAAAAGLAGYQGTADTLAVTGHRLAHDQRVLRAIREEADRRIRAHAVLATSVLIEIAEDPMAQNKDKLKAVEMLLNRGGLHAITESKQIIEHHDLSGKALIERARQLAGELGMDVTKLLGTAGVSEVAAPKPETIDAEFTEVHEEVLMEPVRDEHPDQMEDEI
jgi:hypothetical protein